MEYCENQSQLKELQQVFVVADKWVPGPVIVAASVPRIQREQRSTRWPQCYVFAGETNFSGIALSEIRFTSVLSLSVEVICPERLNADSSEESSFFIDS